MKTILTIARWITGLLFIFSGLIKANDPLGLSYKMQEFFEVWGLHFLHDWSLVFSIVMITFEIVAGVAVITAWRIRQISWLLLALIVFFTFLTAYALFSGKIRECGCFGDCIPLQAKQSFIKDLVLLVLIAFIFANRRRISPSRNRLASVLAVFFSLVFSLALQWFVLLHLPVLDCLPYKKGNNILAQMKAPPGSIPDSTVIMFTYEKNGRNSSFTADNFPADFDDTYRFVKREDVVVRKGNATPAIRDLNLETIYGTDTTAQLLAENGAKLFIFIKDEVPGGRWLTMASLIEQQASAKKIQTYVVTNLDFKTVMAVPELRGWLPLRADGTAIKTVARANPTIYLLDGGAVVNKWSHADFDRALTTVSDLN
jgi:uncharacterized membrane protein YphA (DoxX/SURF4 family)